MPRKRKNFIKVFPKKNTTNRKSEKGAALMIEANGKNLTLRTMTKKELRAMLRKIDTSKPFTDEEADLIYDKMLSQEKRSPTVGIFTKNGEVIGMLIFDSIVFSEYRSDIVINLANKTYCRKGYGTEALMIAKQYAKDILELKKLYAYVSTKDIASQALYKKCGFLHTKTIRDEKNGGEKMLFVSVM